jgi:hypothetical protein
MEALDCSSAAQHPFVSGELHLLRSKRMISLLMQVERIRLISIKVMLANLSIRQFAAGSCRYYLREKQHKPVAKVNQGDLKRSF